MLQNLQILANFQCSLSGTSGTAAKSPATGGLAFAADAPALAVAAPSKPKLKPARWSATWVERFGRRGTEPNELFKSEFGQNSWNLKKTTKSQNSWNRKKTTKNHFIEVAFDPNYKTGPQKNREKGNKLL